ncbi:uncharacterized protein C6orf141 homolog [Molossus molossus]|nr:uncharacterized protein C6orf141 homolog [Molossus molossus]
MNDPPTRMGAPGLRGATRLAHSPLSLGRARSFPPEVGRGPPLASGAPNPAAAVAIGSPGGAHEGCGAEGNLDSASRVREKVLFLLHPERGLGTRADPAWEEVAGGEDLSPAGADDPGRPSPRLPGEERPSGRRGDAPRRAPPRGGARPPRPVLVRVVDYQATEEVQLTEWTRGCVATRTEERSMSVLTFRTHKQ